jgi:hypothetical protein
MRGGIPVRLLGLGLHLQASEEVDLLQTALQFD